MYTGLFLSLARGVIRSCVDNRFGAHKSALVSCSDTNLIKLN
jgi:hypothetical protein